MNLQLKILRYYNYCSDKIATIEKFDEYLFNYALRSHETHETGQVRAPLTGRIRDQKKSGLAFYGISLKFWRTRVNGVTGLFRD